MWLVLTFGLWSVLRLCSAGDSLLEDEFCQVYYPSAHPDYPACSEVKSRIRSNLSRPLPTLELGDPSLPGMFFIHGWPDSAAEWAAQFAHFCASGRFYCVAATWTNFHPDLPDAPEADLRFDKVIDKLAETMRVTGLRSTTLVIHDWGAWIGYQLMNRYPQLVQQTIAFDIGFTCDGCATNVTYQQVNREGWWAHDSTLPRASAEYWWAPCVDCAVWRSAWPYAFNLSMQGLVKATDLGPPKPLLFFWGNMTRGMPRQKDSLFFGNSWLQAVRSLPHGRVIEAPSDHWMHTRVPRFCNEAIDEWLASLPNMQPSTVIFA